MLSQGDTKSSYMSPYYLSTVVCYSSVACVYYIVWVQLHIIKTVVYPVWLVGRTVIWHKRGVASLAASVQSRAAIVRWPKVPGLKLRRLRGTRGKKTENNGESIQYHIGKVVPEVNTGFASELPHHNSIESLDVEYLNKERNSDLSDSSEAEYEQFNSAEFKAESIQFNEDCHIGQCYSEDEPMYQAHPQEVTRSSEQLYSELDSMYELTSDEFQTPPTTPKKLQRTESQSSIKKTQGPTSIEQLSIVGRILHHLTDIFSFSISRGRLSFSLLVTGLGLLSLFAQVHLSVLFGRRVLHVKPATLTRYYGSLPLKAMSRLWGQLNSLEIPVWLRGFILSVYSGLYGVNVSEAEHSNLQYYTSLCHFFRRNLKAGVRPIDQQATVTSPADGKVLHRCEVEGQFLEQVKGVTYSLEGFLGPQKSIIKHESIDEPKPDISAASKEICDVVSPTAIEEEDAAKAVSSNDQSPIEHSTMKHSSASSTTIAQDSMFSLLNRITISDALAQEDRFHEISSGVSSHDLVQNQGNVLYQCIVYLAPGDYHRFHSPCDWTVMHRRHFPGELFSVQPGVARWLRGLFSLNERAVYTGQWKHGYFSMTAVGAVNVGSINVTFDQELQTNSSDCVPAGTYYDHTFPDGHHVKKGELFGDFNLGSTIVLLFEAPPDFTFSVEGGDKVKYGQAL